MRKKIFVILLILILLLGGGILLYYEKNKEYISIKYVLEVKNTTGKGYKIYVPAIVMYNGELYKGWNKLRFIDGEGEIMPIKTDKGWAYYINASTSITCSLSSKLYREIYDLDEQNYYLSMNADRENDTNLSWGNKNIGFWFYSKSSNETRLIVNISFHVYLYKKNHYSKITSNAYMSLSLHGHNYEILSQPAVWRGKIDLSGELENGWEVVYGVMKSVAL